jgi:hypothetical protein
MTLHPFQHGHFLGSGQGEVVLAEAGLDGESQYRAITRYAEARRAVLPLHPLREAATSAADPAPPRSF